MAMAIRGVSASELARRMGVPRQTVHKWLKMPTAELSAVHLAGATDVLNCRMYWLITGKGDLIPRFGSTRRLTT